MSEQEKEVQEQSSPTQPDPLIHDDPVRAALMAALGQVQDESENDLTRLYGPDALSQLEVLQKAGYVDRTVRTTHLRRRMIRYYLTPKGRAALEAYYKYQSSQPGYKPSIKHEPGA